MKKLILGACAVALVAIPLTGGIAEADVAMLAIKGFEILGIAEMRSTAASTVRAQLTRVYAKAGVTSRSQLVCLFIDDLLGGLLPGMDVS